MRQVLVLTIILMLVAGCDYKAEIPTYVYIKKFDLTTNPVTEGSDSELITDGWVYLDDESIGVFQLPARVPIILEGQGHLTVAPGIKLNGISSTRARNPFYQVYEKDIVAAPATVDTLIPSITYKDDVVFPLIEDFETGNDFNGMSRISTQSEVFEGNWCGVIRLSQGDNEFYTRSFEYELPQDGSRVFLEMNYRNTARFNVSILANNFGDLNLEYALTVTPSEEWNKIYVDLTEEVNANKAVNYRLVFSGSLPSGETEADFYFDNIKIVHL